MGFQHWRLRKIMSRPKSLLIQGDHLFLITFWVCRRGLIHPDLTLDILDKFR